MNLNESIISVRVGLQNSNIKKSGKNKYAGFEYFELADFLPTLNALMCEKGINDVFSIEGDYATLTLIKDSEMQTYKMPYKEYPVPLNKNGTPSMQEIQYIGALNTYYKRYLYINAFGITDGEVIDAMDNDDAKAKKETPKKEEPKKATPKLSEEMMNIVNSWDKNLQQWILNKCNVSFLEDVPEEAVRQTLKALEEKNNG